MGLGLDLSGEQSKPPEIELFEEAMGQDKKVISIKFGQEDC